MSCCAVGCKNRYATTDDIHYYRIPSTKTPFEAERRRLWLQAIKRTDWTDEIIQNARLCSAHFISGKASMDPESPDFAPSLFAHSRKCQCTEAQKRMDRFNRKRKRAEAISRSSLADASGSPAAAPGSNTVEPTADAQPPDCREELYEEDAMIPLAIYSELRVQYDQLLTECVNLRTKCNALKEENEQLKEALGSRFSFSSS